MKASVLREAAGLMRERAEAANEGPWVSQRNHRGHHDIWSEPGGDSRFELGFDFVAPDAAHIASWHPAVALAVADWLDAYAEECDLRRMAPNPFSAALAVAHAYLDTPT